MIHQRGLSVSSGTCLEGGSPLTDTNGNPVKDKDASDGPGHARGAWPLFVGLPLIIILMAVVAVLFSGGEERVSQAGSGQPAGGKEPAERQAQAERERASGGGEKLGHPALGEVGAPVVMIEYGDYQ